MVEPFRLYVFDCDGTLVDSQRNIVAAMGAAWARHDLPAPLAADVRRIVGLTLEIAIARSRLAFKCATADVKLTNASATCPPNRSLSAGPAPLYGMCSIWMPAIDFNSSPLKCGDVPLPDEA